MNKSTENKLNYPIKYAVLTLKEKGNFSEGYKDIIRGNIVSKCFIVETSIKYNSDGTSEVFHKVVFPFKSLEVLKSTLMDKSEYIGVKKIPKYDANNNPCPVDIVYELFETFEEAKIKAREENDKMRRLLELKINISSPDCKKQLINYEQEFDKEISICELFEKISLENTKDMIITSQKDEDKKLKLIK